MWVGYEILVGYRPLIRGVGLLCRGLTGDIRGLLSIGYMSGIIRMQDEVEEKVDVMCIMDHSAGLCGGLMFSRFY